MTLPTATPTSCHPIVLLLPFLSLSPKLHSQPSFYTSPLKPTSQTLVALLVSTLKSLGVLHVKEESTMAFTTLCMLTTLLTLSISYPAIAQTAAAPPSFAPAPAPGPAFVNLTDLLSVAGPFHTFLNYLVQTQVIETFQNQANNTEQGITIFVPKDSAFSAIKKGAFTNLTQDQLKSLLLLHAIPKYYSLSEFKNISGAGPVNTFAGGQYALNVTDAFGLIHVGSDWANTKVTSSVYSTYPVALYEVDKVLLPKAIFAADPPMAPAPAPAPDVVAADAPSSLKGTAEAPKGSDSSSKQDSSSHFVTVGGLSYLVVAASAGLMAML